MPPTGAGRRRIGEKTAATLLGEHGTLAGLLAAAAEAAGGLSGLRAAKLAAAADYLEVAPPVVKVVRDLELPTLEQRARSSARSSASLAPNSNGSPPSGTSAARSRGC